MQKLFLLFSVSVALAGAATPARVNTRVCAPNVTTCATTWSVTAGNIITVGSFNVNNSPLPTAASDDKGSGAYTSLGNVNAYASNTLVLGAVAGSGGILTVTLDQAATMLTLTEWSGATLAKDVPTVTNWTGGSSVFATITTTSANDLVICSGMAGDYSPNYALTGGTLFGPYVPVASMATISSFNVGAAGPYTYTYDNIQGNGSMVLVALKAASGGGGGGTVPHRKVRSN
jgi:hypothetical protein